MPGAADEQTPFEQRQIGDSLRVRIPLQADETGVHAFWQVPTVINPNAS